MSVSSGTDVKSPKNRRYSLYMTVIFNRHHISETFYDSWIQIDSKNLFKVSC